MTNPYNLPGYYSRFDPTKHYEKHLVRADFGAQSAEINEIQDNFLDRLKRVGDAIMADGNIRKDGQALVDSTTGATTMQAGAVYLRGAVRDVATATFTIPVDQTVAIGVRLVEAVITELEDPALRDPAEGTRNYDEAGAARLRVTATWGWDGDGGSGEFFPVYTVENGVVLSKEPPPALDGVTTAIARYDRDSAGGNYVVSGYGVTASFDKTAGKLTHLVGEGRARVNGFSVEAPRSIRKIEDMDRETLAIVAEPHTFTPDGTGNMRVDLYQAPLVTLDQVRMTVQKLVTITHGAFDGAMDTLPDNSVLSIVAVNQGGTTYAQGTAYKLTAGKVDWSATGQPEPAPGSTYQVVYQYQTTAATITGQDSKGFTLSGAVAGSIFTVDYHFALPRIDAIVLDEDGRVVRLKGVASQYAPAAPSVPTTQLKIASLYHTWDADPAVTQDAVVVMPMNEIQAMKSMVLDLYDLVAQERLRNAIGLTDPAAKRGVFVDPLNNDNLRDAGVTQTAAVFGGLLTQAIDATVSNVGTITTPVLLDYTLETLIEQPNRTGSMKVNPYQAFDPLPAKMKLDPGVDYWTGNSVVWASEITQRFVYGWGNASLTTTSTAVQQVSSTVTYAQYLRQVPVKFTLSGFGAGEVLQSLTFDGIPVTPTAV